MNGAPDLLVALEALTAAVGALEAAAARRNARDEHQNDRDTELSLMRADREGLAQQLDLALADAGALNTTRTEVAARLDHAIGVIRTILAAKG